MILKRRRLLFWASLNNRYYIFVEVLGKSGRMVDVFSQFSLDMQDGLLDDDRGMSSGGEDEEVRYRTYTSASATGVHRYAVVVFTTP